MCEAAHADAGVHGEVRSPPGNHPSLLCGARSVTTPTGALTLDLALGGGYPKGRVVEIYGPGATAASRVFCCGGAVV